MRLWRTSRSLVDPSGLASFDYCFLCILLVLRMKHPIKELSESVEIRVRNASSNSKNVCFQACGKSSKNVSFHACRKIWAILAGHKGKYTLTANDKTFTGTFDRENMILLI